MYVKIVTLKEISKDCHAVDRTHVIECEEYQRYTVHDSKVPPKEKTLVLRLIRNKQCFREMLFDKPEQPVDIFIENNEGKTIGRLEYPRRD